MSAHVEVMDLVAQMKSAEQPFVLATVVSDDYFRAMRIPLVEGDASRDTGKTASDGRDHEMAHREAHFCVRRINAPSGDAGRRCGRGRRHMRVLRFVEFVRSKYVPMSYQKFIYELQAQKNATLSR